VEYPHTIFWESCLAQPVQDSREIQLQGIDLLRQARLSEREFIFPECSEDFGDKDTAESGLR
jgi:hypothetical protein